LIAAYEEYRSYEIEQLRDKQTLSYLKGKQLEKYLVTRDYSLVYEEDDDEEE